jgi:AraC-like DNA-binding protein
MDNFFKYLTVGAEDKEWGVYLNVAGKAKIAPHTDYPPKEHPTGYFFTWEKGRILQEFQINYITEGSGVLENEFGKFKINPGTIMLTRPGAWHRYQPNEETGWVENYIGMDGEWARQLFNKSFFPKDQSVIHCGMQTELIDTFYKIFDLVKKENPGFQQIASGLIIKALGYIVTSQKQSKFAGTQIEKIIQKARFMIRENIEEDMDWQRLANENNVGYSYFRKMFKKYTGVSPHQYQLDLKMFRAKELILTTDMSVKEISYELGFQSAYYFSRLFKKKVGTNPSDLRK